MPEKIFTDFVIVYRFHGHSVTLFFFFHNLKKDFFHQQKPEMTRSAEEPNTLLWVLRGLASAFLLGYLLNIFFAVLLYERFPAGSMVQDLPAIGLLILFGFGYYLMWIRKEILTGLIFILWYAALWPLEILIGGNNFESSTAPGTILLILGILFLVYRSGISIRQRAANRSTIKENQGSESSRDETSE